MTARRKTALEWTDRARDDLVEIGDYIAADAPRAAERWVAELFEAAEAASKAPLAGRRVRELGRDDLREVLVGNYRVVYRVLPDRIQVLTVFEGHRRLPSDVTEDEG